jgi:hypothetical protein
MKCKDCKFWVPPKGKDFGAVWGDCPKLLDNELIEIYPEYGDSDFGIVIDVHPDFGCVLGESQ